MINMCKVAVLIPCYNEAQTIAKVVSDAKRCLPGADVYVYDNNSTDGTAKIARSAGAIVRHEPSQGKGNVVRSMFRDIDADCYLMVDGDDTYPLEYAPMLIKPVLSGDAEMAIGDRLSSTYHAENKRPFHSLGNNLVRTLTNFLFSGQITDVMTGYRAFSKYFAKSFPAFSEGFEIETEMTAFALHGRLPVASIAVPYRDRPEGSKSKLHTIRDGAKVLRMLFRLFFMYKLPLWNGRRQTTHTAHTAHTALHAKCK